MCVFIIIIIIIIIKFQPYNIDFNYKPLFIALSINSYIVRYNEIVNFRQTALYVLKI